MKSWTICSLDSLGSRALNIIAIPFAFRIQTTIRAGAVCLCAAGHRLRSRGQIGEHVRDERADNQADECGEATAFKGHSTIVLLTTEGTQGPARAAPMIDKEAHATCGEAIESAHAM